jgi:hypothetical protein
MRERSELKTEVKKMETKGLAPVYSIETRYITELVFVFIYTYIYDNQEKKKHEAHVTDNGNLI